MIERALKLKLQIDRFCTVYGNIIHGKETSKKPQNDDNRLYLLKNDMLDKDDQDTLKEIMAILYPFYMLTKRIEGNKLLGDQGVLSNYLTTFNQLLIYMRSQKNDLTTRVGNPDLNSPALKHLKVCYINRQTKLNEYFTKVD